ncbi:MAG: hypothetical protein U0Q18_35955 [Bryobacteraceae bacterium]
MTAKITGWSATLAFGCLLFGADNAFVGTWKMNVAKSSAIQFDNGKLVKKGELKDPVLTVTVEGDTITVRGHATTGGQSASMAFTMPAAGGHLSYTEGAPPAGIADTMKTIDDRTEEIISTMNGKVVLNTRVAVSANHKTMTLTESGVDETGKPFKAVAVYDRQ